MYQLLHTALKGTLVLTDELDRHPELLRDTTLYKFLWVQQGTLTVTIDHVRTELHAGVLIPLTPLHRLSFEQIEGNYLSLLFNSNFYCIFGHDDEVSCNGLLFTGAAEPLRLSLDAPHQELLTEVMGKLRLEFVIADTLREEMLRILLKRLIISCTRMARERYGVTPKREKSFDIVRQYHILVDQYFREKHQVHQYAELLHRSPKTLSNLFASYGVPSPLRILHERIEAEARRLLRDSRKSVKEIAALLGFDDPAELSRLFKKLTGESLSDYRQRTSQLLR